MPTIHVRALAPLSRALLASLCLTLPAACGIEDVYITPPDPAPDAGPFLPGLDAGAGDPTNPQSIYYDLNMLATEIQPAIDDAGCSIAGCHELGSGSPLELFSYPAPGSYEMWSNLQALTIHVQLGTTPFSAVNTLLYLRATDRHRFVQLFDPAPLQAWIEDAAARYGSNDDLFDAEVFANEIHPMLVGCALAGCHLAGSSVTGFAVHPTAAPGSLEMFADLQATTSKVDLALADAADTEMFIRATDRHTSVAVDDPALLHAWIQAALDGNNP
jgi:hypothetical protein